jgi:hypothetical protein
LLHATKIAAARTHATRRIVLTRWVMLAKKMRFCRGIGR